MSINFIKEYIFKEYFFNEFIIYLNRRLTRFIKSINKERLYNLRKVI